LALWLLVGSTWELSWRVNRTMRPETSSPITLMFLSNWFSKNWLLPTAATPLTLLTSELLPVLVIKSAHELLPMPQGLNVSPEFEMVVLKIGE
jgi:hypothetical protein